MINGVEMIYDYCDPIANYTYSYIGKDGECYVYCKTCKKFEKMNVLVSFDIRKNCSNKLYFENYCNDLAFKEQDNGIILRKGVRFYTYERFLKAINRKYGFLNNYYYYKRNRDKGTLFREPIAYICPECRTSYPKHKILYFESRQKDPKEFCHGVQIFKETINDKVYIKAVLLFLEFGIWNNAIILNRFRKKVTLNITTGHTYAIKKRYIDGSNRKVKEASIKNITYSDEYSSAGFFDINRSFIEDATIALYKAVYNEKEKMLNHKPDGYPKEIPLEVKPYRILSYVSALNRFPNIHYNIYSTIIKTQRDDYATIMNKNMYKVKMNADDWTTEAIKAHKMQPTKFNKRLVRSGAHPDVIKNITNIFKEPNNIKKLINSEFNNLRKYHLKSDFIMDSIALCGETATVNKIISAPYFSYLVDTINMYHTAKEILGSYNITGTIKEIHDNLSRDYEKLKKENLIIRYEDKVKSLEYSDDEYDLVFAKDTHELIDVGSYMRICVGSYGNRAAQKDCNIMILRNKENIPIVCIELSSDYKTIYQAKFFANGRMPQKEFDFVHQWVKNNKIKIATSDLDFPLKENKKENTATPVDLEDLYTVEAIAF